MLSDRYEADICNELRPMHITLTRIEEQLAELNENAVMLGADRFAQFLRVWMRYNDQNPLEYPIDTIEGDQEIETSIKRALMIFKRLEFAWARYLTPEDRRL